MNLGTVDNDDYLQVIRTNMPPDLILSVWLIVPGIMFGDNMETDTTLTLT